MKKGNFVLIGFISTIHENDMRKSMKEFYGKVVNEKQVGNVSLSIPCRGTNKIFFFEGVNKGINGPSALQFVFLDFLDLVGNVLNYYRPVRLPLA